ncbi:hypothetical protein ACFQMA_00385 [Halosimplex aquaticum]|uniref:DUF8048 domain-containing protein n=1 Tax=Halosimplex aquaticum TaxID=3026162 RepID=A0ABD5XXF2_9EURY|nr:hypothetical protein [Halosimplex aquaticum]
MTRDELAAFDEAVLAEAADEHGVSADRLADLVRTHQSNVRDLPGVEDIVYEWRNYFHRDPLVGRTEGAYYLALPDHVWEEFAEDMDIEGAERAALLAVHDRQARTADPDAGVDTSRLDADEALVLTRP